MYMFSFLSLLTSYVQSCTWCSTSYLVVNCKEFFFSYSVGVVTASYAASILILCIMSGYYVLLADVIVESGCCFHVIIENFTKSDKFFRHLLWKLFFPCPCLLNQHSYPWQSDLLEWIHSKYRPISYKYHSHLNLIL